MARDVLVRWPGPETKAIALLTQLGAKAVITPFSGEQVASLKAAWIVPVAEIEKFSSIAELEKQVTAAREAGYDGVAFPALADEPQTRAFAAKNKGIEQFIYLKLDHIHWNIAPAHAVLRAGQWPGLRPTDATLATASEAPWIDSNAYLVAYLRGVFPARPALLGYRDDEDAGVKKDRMLPPHSLALALAETRATGGNVLLTVPARYREQLLEGQQRALASWKSLAETASFLAEHTDEFRQPVASRIGAAVGKLEDDLELVNMLHRVNATPVIFPVASLPSHLRSGLKVLVTSSIGPAGSEAKSAMAFATAGGTVLATPSGSNEKPWWVQGGAKKSKAEQERDFYSAGKGTIVGYHDSLVDPYELALDVIDALGRRTSDLRLWSADGVVGTLHRQPDSRLTVELVNYGRPLEPDFLMRVEGIFKKATMRRPEGGTVDLKPSRRGTGTEVLVPNLQSFATILFE